MDQTQLTPLKLVPIYEGTALPESPQYYEINTIYVCKDVGDILSKKFPEIFDKGVNPIELWKYAVDVNADESETANDILDTIRIEEANWILSHLSNLDPKYTIKGELNFEEYIEESEDDDYWEDDEEDFEEDDEDDGEENLLDGGGDNLDPEDVEVNDSNSEEINTIN